MPRRIDAHQHFWNYNPAEYGWINDAMGVIRRDFLPQDLQPVLAATGIDGSVAVQARSSLAETEWLLNLAGASDLVRGVVGWVPLTAPDVSAALDRLAADGKFKGVRHVLHDEADGNYVDRDNFNDGIRSLTALGLTYDLLIIERHLPQTIAFVDRHPDQIFVLDHIAKPRIRENILEPWRSDMFALAERQNVFCKLSGLVTEADPTNWSEAQLQPYMATALGAERLQRLMFGSDWPVCLVGCPYERWLEVVTRFASQLSVDERGALFGGTATQVYRLDT